MSCKIEWIEHRPGVPALRVSYDDMELFTFFSASTSLLGDVEPFIPDMVDDFVSCLERCNKYAKPEKWDKNKAWFPCNDFVDARDGARFLIDQFMVKHFAFKSKWTMKGLFNSSRAMGSDMTGGIEISTSVGDILQTGRVRRLEQKIVCLENGRVYRIIDTGIPYEDGEYPKGGWKIDAQDARFDNGWCFIDFSPSMEEVENFLKSAERLDPLPPEAISKESSS